MPVLTGNSEDNTLFGTRQSDIISGLAGDDRLFGRGGDDFISGGPGIDRLAGGAGNDIFFVDPDDRPIDGGPGTDVAILTQTDGSYVFGPSTLRHVEGLQDLPGSDTHVTMDAAALRTVDGNTFRFALGDGGNDTVTLVDDGRLSLANGELVYDNRVHLQFEGTETITVIDRFGGSHVLTSQVAPTAISDVGFAGPGSVAGKAAAAYALSPDHSVQQNGDLRPIADLLTQFRLEGNTPALTQGDIHQTAEIVQRALGHGNVDQIAAILQDATTAGGHIDQNAAITQVADTTGGNIDQVASIVQKAVAYALPPQAGVMPVDIGGGTGASSTSQSASIDQSAHTSGGSTTQEASIHQTAGTSQDGLFLMH
jgi:hypothetical protein